VAGVIVLYLALNLVCVRILGPDGLAATTVPATAVMRAAMGGHGAQLIALCITVSTLGISQPIHSDRTPRLLRYGGRRLFFRRVAYVNARTRVPIVAIILQSVWTTVIALSGRYDQIRNYVVATDFVFFGLTGTCIPAYLFSAAGTLAHVTQPFGKLQSVPPAILSSFHPRHFCSRLLVGGSRYHLQVPF